MELETDTSKYILIHQLLALFSRFSTCDFLRSNDNGMLVDVVNNSFSFFVTLDSFKIIDVMRDA